MRCEICYQLDDFDAINNICHRCSKSDPMRLAQNKKLVSSRGNGLCHINKLNAKPGSAAILAAARYVQLAEAAHMRMKPS